MDKKLEKYQKKIKNESIIKSIIFSLVIGFSVILLLSLIFFIAHTKQVLVTIILGVISAIAAGILIYIYKYKPTINSVAKRVDSLGLEERVITMVDFKDEEGFIYQKQREDANTKLETIDEKAIKLKLSKPLIVVLGVVMVLGLCSFALPKLPDSSSNNSTVIIPPPSSDTSTSIPEEEPPVLDEDAIIAELLQKLRDLINNSAVGQDFKDELLAIVDQLEIDIKSLDTLEEKIAAIDKAREDIKQKIEEELLRLSIGRCLKQNEITSELGNVILLASGDESKIPQVGVALNNILENLKNSENYEDDLNKLIEALTYAIDTATKEKNTALVEALTNFRDSLIGSEETVRLFRKLAGKDDIDEIFNQSNEEIQDALKKILEDFDPEQGNATDDVEDLGESLDQAIQDAKDQLDNLVSDEGKDDIDDSDEGNDNPPPTFDDGDIESDTVLDGKTQYLTVFDEYYAEIVDYLSNNEDIPDDVREIIEKYLEMIKA